MDESALLPLAAVLSFLVGLFYALAESAQLTITPSLLEEELSDHRPSDIEQLIAGCARRHLHCLVLGLTATITFGLCVERLTRGLPWWGSWLVAIGATLAVPVFGGRVLAQTWAARHSTGVFKNTLPIVRLSQWTLGWLTTPMSLLLVWLGKVFGLDGVMDRPFLLPHDLMAALVDTQGQETVADEQMAMIENIFELRDADVAEVMTPRTDMMSIDVEAGVEAAIALALDKGISRIPVYQGNRDTILGIFYVKDVLRYWDTRETATPSLADLVREPLFVPESKRIDALLRELQAAKVHLAIVLDEYGGTSGLVTIEDILEEIVGEIEDEYDPQESQVLRIISNTTTQVQGTAHIDEVNEQLNISLPENDDYDTLGGFIFAQMGCVPAQGERLSYENIELTILEADERRIKRVEILVNDAAPQS